MDPIASARLRVARCVAVQDAPIPSSREVPTVAMVAILANMPDLWQRLLIVHVPDANGRCWDCRDSQGRAAVWPCVPRKIAEQAAALYESRAHDVDPPAPPPHRGPGTWPYPGR